MQAYQVTNAATQVVPPGNIDAIHVYNNSDSIVYLGYDGDAAHVTVAAGMPLAAGAYLLLTNDGTRNLFIKGLWAIHNTTGNKELRIQGA